MSGHEYSFEQKRLLDDLFLRGVRANPRDMALAAEKFRLLEMIVDRDARLEAIIDRVLLLRIALLRNLLSENFDDLEKKPELLRDWELGIDRPSFPEKDKEGPRLLGEILRPIRSGEDGGSFAELLDVDLGLYSSLAVHDAERAIRAAKEVMFDIGDRVGGIREKLDRVSKDGGHYDEADAALFEQIINPYRQVMRNRYDQPPDLNAFITALIEIARTDSADMKRVTKFFDYVCTMFPMNVALIRWEIIVRATTLKDPQKLIELVRARAKNMLTQTEHKGKCLEFRADLLKKDQILKVGKAIGSPTLQNISRFPVTNRQYEKFDREHSVLRYSGASAAKTDDCPVAFLNLIEAAMFCEWLNAVRNPGDLWAHIPTVWHWQQAVRDAVKKNAKIEKIANTVWEWTTSSLDDNPKQNCDPADDVLTKKALPHVWICGGSWFQRRPEPVEDREAVEQTLWMPPMHHRPDVGFRIFWYNEDRYKSLRTNGSALTDAENGVKEGERTLDKSRC